MKIFWTGLMIVLVLYGAHLHFQVDTGIYVTKDWQVECIVEMETRTVCESQYNFLSNGSQLASFWSPGNPLSPLNPYGPNRNLLNFGQGKSLDHCEEVSVVSCQEYKLVRKQ